MLYCASIARRLAACLRHHDIQPPQSSFPADDPIDIVRRCARGRPAHRRCAPVESEPRWWRPLGRTALGEGLIRFLSRPAALAVQLIDRRSDRPVRSMAWRNRRRAALVFDGSGTVPSGARHSGAGRACGRGARTAASSSPSQPGGGSAALREAAAGGTGASSPASAAAPRLTRERLVSKAAYRV